MVKTTTSVMAMLGLVCALPACGDDDGGGGTVSDTTGGGDTSAPDTTGGGDTSAPDTTGGGDTSAPDTSAPDTTPGGACDFTPCSGGDPIGTWQLTDLCIVQSLVENPFAQLPGCDDADFEVLPAGTGTFTFGAGTFSYALQLAGDVHIALDADCMASLQGLDCNTLAAQFANEGLTVACASAAGGCDCTGEAAAQESTGEGTWSVSGDELTIVEGDGDPVTSKVCIQGDTMRFQRFGNDSDASVESVVTLER